MRKELKQVRLSVLALAAAMVLSGGVAQGQSRTPKPGASQKPWGAIPTVLNGKARFQVLNPKLVRLEYAGSGEFIDAPSVAVIGRDRWAPTPFEQREENGWLTIARLVAVNSPEPTW